ncbi:MAG: helix-turn-helix domain-containing protein [Cyanobacteria bacterium P01_C01_bin.72]
MTKQTKQTQHNLDNSHNLNSEQQQLKDLGAKLQQIRVAQNMSLNNVAQATLISPRLLKAIEAGDLTELPEPFYIQALVRKYAASIGAQEVYFQDISTQTSSMADAKQQNQRQIWFNFQLRSLHLYLLYILLVIVSVSGISVLVERPVIINQAPSERPILVPEQPPQTTAQVSQPPTTPQFVSQANNSEAVSVGINLQERCWLKVMVDGKVAFEGILPAGTNRQWNGQKEVTIRAGNAGGVVISFNNQQQQVLGAPGQVEEITYTVN